METKDIVCLTLYDNYMSGTKVQEGEVIGLVRGFEGYRTTTYGIQNREFVEKMNIEQYGVTPDIEDAYCVISVFGKWDSEDKILKSMTENAQKNEAAAKRS